MLLPILLALLLILLATAYLALLLLSPHPQRSTPPEQHYLSSSSPSTPLPLPSLHDPPSCALSVVIPAYNETLRLGPMLDEALPYLSAHHSASSSSSDATDHPASGQTGYEVLIVDDGSSDATTATALAYARAHPAADIRIVTLQRNRGKGGAVKHGVLHARGARILFVDADGATRFEDLRRLWKECARLERVGMEGAGGYAAVVGSRAHLVGTDAVVKRSFIRNVLMHGLHVLLRTLGVGHIQDTQCGFKLFSRPCAQLIFPPLHVTSWMFDVELLILCGLLGVPVSEIPVGWHEVGGSKINLVWDSLGMLRDLVVVRANYAIGRWRIPTKPVARTNGHAKE